MSAQSETLTVWTLGHSTRTIDEFLDLLNHYHIDTVIDVRSMPGSRKYPHYDQEALTATLALHGIAYHWLKSLGGRRRALRNSPNIAWRNTSFRGYADHMASAEFAQGLDQVKEIAAQARPALMCAEAVWWRCHRSMVADALCVDGIAVFHIMDATHCPAHPMTSPARIVDGQLTYSEPSPAKGRASP